MTYWKKLLAASFALLSVFIFTFNTTALAAKATTPSIAPEDALKIRTQITDLQTRLDAFDDSFDDANWVDVEKQFPAFVKDARSSLDELTSKVITPTTQAKYDAITEKFNSYFTKLDEANTSYKTTQSEYDTATKSYQDAVKSTYDKVAGSLDAFLKLIPQAE